MKLFGRQFGGERPSEADDLVGFKAKKTGPQDLQPTQSTPPVREIPVPIPAADLTLEQKVAIRDQLQAVVTQREQQAAYFPDERTRGLVKKLVALDSDPEVRAYDDALDDAAVMHRTVESQLARGQRTAEGDQFLAAAAGTARKWLREDAASEPATPTQDPAKVRELNQLAARWRQQREQPSPAPSAVPSAEHQPASSVAEDFRARLEQFRKGSGATA